jgi:hypothetical protein
MRSLPTSVPPSPTHPAVDFLNRFEKHLRRIPPIAAAEVATALITAGELRRPDLRLARIARSDHGALSTSQVRTRLSAGGRWVRTIGTPEREAYFFPGRNSLAGTASRRGRAVGSNGQRSVRSVTSAMAASGNRPFCGSAFWRVHMPAVGPGQQVAAAGLVRPIFPGAPGLDRIGAVARLRGSISRCDRYLISPPSCRARISASALRGR